MYMCIHTYIYQIFLWLCMDIQMNKHTSSSCRRWTVWRRTYIYTRTNTHIQNTRVGICLYVSVRIYVCAHLPCQEECIHICVYSYTYIRYTRVHIYTYRYMYIYINVNACIHKYVYACMHTTYMYAKYTCLYVCIYNYMCRCYV